MAAGACVGARAVARVVVIVVELFDDADVAGVNDLLLAEEETLIRRRRRSWKLGMIRRTWRARRSRLRRRERVKRIDDGLVGVGGINTDSGREQIVSFRRYPGTVATRPYGGSRDCVGFGGGGLR